MGQKHTYTQKNKNATMTKRELFKILKQERLFSIFCAYLAAVYESRIPTPQGLKPLFQDPRTNLEYTLNAMIKKEDSLRAEMNNIKQNWKCISKPKIIYGKKRILQIS